MSSSFIGKVLDNYRIIERLGTGGMGVVFKAIHIKLDKVVALKIISPSLAINENFLSRFESEAKALAKLEDPNIVRIYDLRSDNDRWFIVMEYVEGITLSEMIEKYVRFPWKKSLPLFKQMLNAIAHAHESGIIHRDIKPNNIMLTENGIVKVTDFGLAKDTTVTQTMTVTSGGTLHYMSPEHVKGFSFIDARSDIYSLGMTFYEMLTGMIPFKQLTSDFEIREAIVRKEFDKPSKLASKIPPEVDDLIMKAIRKNPDDRFQSADEMIEVIEDIEIKNKLPFEQPQYARRSSTSKVTLERQKSGSPDTNQDQQKTTTTKKRKKIPVLYLSAAVILLSLVVYFLLKFESDIPDLSEQLKSPADSTLITVITNPADATVFLNEEVLEKTPSNEYYIPPGKYKLRVSKTSYAQLDTTVEIKEFESARFHFSLRQSELEQVKANPEPARITPEKPVQNKPKFAKVVIRTNPPKAAVYLNGSLYGNSPVNITDLEPGTYQIEASLEGFERYTEILRVDAGNSRVLQPRLRPHTGNLFITKEPEYSLVFLDGKEISINQNPVEVQAGTHLLEVKSPGFSTFSRNLEVKKNETTEIKAELKRLEGELSVQVRPWGSIYINGELKKQSADIRYNITMPVEEHEVKVVHPTLGYWQKQVKVEDGKTTEIEVNFTKKISIQISAVDQTGQHVPADIYVDGENTGRKCPEQIPVRVGIRKISLKKDGFMVLDGEKEIFVDENAEKQISFSLRKES